MHNIFVMFLSALVFLVQLNCAFAFGSEEHKLIGDKAGNALFKNRSFRKAISSTGAVFRASSGKFDSAKKRNYRQVLSHAKRFAIGSKKGPTKKRNLSGCYDAWLSVRDEAYSHTKDNKKIKVPKRSGIPAKILLVPTIIGDKPELMTFGELIALYGDYRRTTYCDTKGCYLTHKPVNSIQFKPNAKTKKGKAKKKPYCPKPIASSDYLRIIASGVVPPFGYFGNVATDTAKAGDLANGGWWGDEMMRLANTNEWHFTDSALAWYLGMHRLALESIRRAVMTGDEKYIIRALHQEANALHTFTDLFALGHNFVDRTETVYTLLKQAKLDGRKAYKLTNAILKLGGASRNQKGVLSLPGKARFKIPGNVYGKRSDYLPSSNHRMLKKDGRNAFLLKSGMSEKTTHDEKNEHGGLVRNLRKDEFRVFGDHGYLKLKSKHAKIAHQAVARSVASLTDMYADMLKLKAVHSGQRLQSELNDLTRKFLKPGNGFYAALNYLPLVVKKDFQAYKPYEQRFVRHAKTLYRLTGKKGSRALMKRCKLPFKDGRLRRLDKKINTDYVCVNLSLSCPAKGKFKTKGYEGCECKRGQKKFNTLKNKAWCEGGSKCPRGNFQNDKHKGCVCKKGKKTYNLIKSNAWCEGGSKCSKKTFKLKGKQRGCYCAKGKKKTPVGILKREARCR